MLLWTNNKRALATSHIWDGDPCLLTCAADPHQRIFLLCLTHVMQMTHIEDRRLFVLVVTSCCYEKQELSCLKVQPFFPRLCLAQNPKGSCYIWKCSLDSWIMSCKKSPVIHQQLFHLCMAVLSLLKILQYFKGILWQSRAWQLGFSLAGNFEYFTG